MKMSELADDWSNRQKVQYKYVKQRQENVP